MQLTKDFKISVINYLFGDSNHNFDFRIYDAQLVELRCLRGEGEGGVDG